MRKRFYIVPEVHIQITEFDVVAIDENGETHRSTLMLLENPVVSGPTIDYAIESFREYKTKQLESDQERFRLYFINEDLSSHKEGLVFERIGNIKYAEAFLF